MAFRKVQAIALAFCFCICCGCASHQKVTEPEPIVKTEYVYKTQTVEVPIYKVMPIKPVKCPTLPVTLLTDKSTYSEISSAYFNTVQILLKYTRTLEKSLQPSYEAYKKNGN